jgi:hypothetical protein
MILSESVEQNSQVGAALVWIGTSVCLGLAQSEEELQSSCQRASLVGIGHPRVELSSGDFGSGTGEAVDGPTRRRIESLVFGHQVEDSEPDR